MNRATKFRSFSPLSWPHARASKTLSALMRRKKRKTALDGIPETISPYEDSAYEADLEVCISTATFHGLVIA